MKYPTDELTVQLFSEAGIGAGMRVLDIGCGHGEVSRLVASLVGDSGSVVGVDKSASTIAIATARLQEFGIVNAEVIHSDVDELPSNLGTFDAVVGRRVLMYLPSPAETLRNLTRHLHRGGIVAFQELYLSMDPISSEVDMPLHRTVQQWIRSTVAYEGGNLQMGLDLYRVFEDAGLVDIRVRAAADVQTPMQPSNLATVVAAILPRILASGVTTEAEVDIETLQQRLDVERDRANATSISELKFAAFARNGAS